MSVSRFRREFFAGARWFRSISSKRCPTNATVLSPSLTTKWARVPCCSQEASSTVKPENDSQMFRAFAAAFLSASVIAGGGILRAEQESTVKNRPIGGPAAKHRVAITAWSLVAPRCQVGLDTTVKAFENDFVGLCFFLRKQGFDGLEISLADIKGAGYCPKDLSNYEAVRFVQEICKLTGCPILGTVLHVTDGGAPIGRSLENRLDFGNPNFWEQLHEVLRVEKLLGAEYATFQIDLPETWKGTGGAYRGDNAFLQLCAHRINQIQMACAEHGMNFYLETHVDRISEDPEALCKIFDICPCNFEVNLDLSHFLYRNIHRGPHFDRIIRRAGHTHQRLARKHGDISSGLGIHFDSIGSSGDPIADWNTDGVTRQAMEAMQPVLERGLSSRTVCSESGPALAVRDALALDIALMPLWQAMARVADGNVDAAKECPWR